MKTSLRINYYKLSTYFACYAPQFQHVPHKDHWITAINMSVDLHPNPTLLRKSNKSKSSCHHNEMDPAEPSAQQ